MHFPYSGVGKAIAVSLLLLSTAGCGKRQYPVRGKVTFEDGSPLTKGMVVFESMEAVARNGVLVLTSITGGNRSLDVPADRINLEFVLGNKVMVGSVNASRDNFETGVRDMSQAEAEYPGWLKRLLTHPVRGLQNYQELFERLQSPNGAIKIYCEVATQ